MSNPVEFNTLFKYDSTGKSRMWDFEVDPSNGAYRTIHGIVGSSDMQTSEWVYCSPKNVGKKNETSAAEQAFKEGQAAWRKKVKEGYHTDIEQSGVTFFEPMLAQTYSPKKFGPKDRGFIQPKLDGIRCIATKKGLFSRTGEPILSVPHIWEQVAPIFDEHPGLVLDGELYTHKYRHKFQTLLKKVRKTVNLTPEVLQEAKIMEYHIYDGFFEDDEPRMAFSDRWTRLKSILLHFAPKDIRRVSTAAIMGYTEADLWEEHDKVVSEGYEGLMVRRNDEYQSGKRSKSLLKMKRFDDDEYIVMDVLEGNTRGKAEKIVCQTKDGKETFFPNIAASDEECIEILREKTSFVGKMATIRYQGFTDSGIPRFPQAKAFHEEARW
jgi:DNA ligase-1